MNFWSTYQEFSPPRGSFLLLFSIYYKQVQGSGLKRLFNAQEHGEITQIYLLNFSSQLSYVFHLDWDVWLNSCLLVRFVDERDFGAQLYISNICDGWKVWSNGTTSVPKSVPRFVLDKVRQVPESEVHDSNILF